jgi:hypothetical protein
MIASGLSASARGKSLYILPDSRHRIEILASS